MQDNEPLMRALAKVRLALLSFSVPLPVLLFNCFPMAIFAILLPLSFLRSRLLPRLTSPVPNITISPCFSTQPVRLRQRSANAQLVTVNNPDKILFVGEALVGNEAVDQLTKFDRALKDFSSAGIGGGSRKRGIDGIILTKFDTIVSHLFILIPPLMRREEGDGRNGNEKRKRKKKVS